MRRRIPWIASIIVLFVAVLSGCGGSKNADSVVKDLNKVAGNLDSYQGSGEMILHTGQQPLTYKVEVWYQKPQYYRIALTNEARDITQIVLRNDEGVFVLTPRLNKSYRFQSDWPENQGQVYLYQTLLQSIALDNSRQFTIDKDAYVFDVMAGNYQNGSFARQKIWLSKSDYKPQQVQVTDTNSNLMVEVKFTSFEFGKKFDKSAFDMQQNMSGAPGASPSSGDSSAADKGDSSAKGNGDNANNSGDKANSNGDTANNSGDKANSNGDTANNSGDNANSSGSNANSDGDTASSNGDTAEGTADNGTASPDGTTDGQTDAPTGAGVADEGTAGADGSDGSAGQEQSLVVVEPDPDALPEGVALKDVSEDLDLGGRTGVMMRYSGTYDFTLVESLPKDEAVSMSKGIMLDLGFTWGLLSDDEATRSLTWTYDGVEYRMTTGSDGLPQEDMARVAQSMVDSSGK